MKNNRNMWWEIGITFLFSILHKCDSVCQFQNPFYFIDRPSVVTVVDSSGQMVADRLVTEKKLKAEILLNISYLQSKSHLGQSSEL